MVLVTGGTGLLGRGIQAALADDPEAGDESWIFASSKDVNLIDWKSTEALFEKHKPTHVIHLAAKVGGLSDNASGIYTENTTMNGNVRDCSRIYNVQKLVSCLSTCVFSDKTGYPIDETMVHNGPPHPSSNAGYSVAMREVDDMNRIYKKMYGCNFTSIIPTNVYGPHDDYEIDGGDDVVIVDSNTVIPGLIHKCYLAKQKGEDLTLWGSGSPLRQFIHSEDLGRLTVWVMREYNDVEPIILSCDEAAEVPIDDVVQMVASAMKLEGKIVKDTTRSDGQHKKTVSNAKLRAFKPDYKFKPIEEGIQETVDWFLANYETASKGPEADVRMNMGPCGARLPELGKCKKVQVKEESGEKVPIQISDIEMNKASDSTDKLQDPLTRLNKVISYIEMSKATNISRPAVPQGQNIFARIVASVDPNTPLPDTGTDEWAKIHKRVADNPDQGRDRAYVIDEKNDAIEKSAFRSLPARG